uniref:Uncharacterized protein n=1 Tax=Oryza rufipogon TaxID=4529 RepID=A0A0E0NFA7_ORYRU
MTPSKRTGQRGTDTVPDKDDIIKKEEATAREQTEQAAANPDRGNRHRATQATAPYNPGGGARDEGRRRPEAYNEGRRRPEARDEQRRVPEARD